MKIKNIIPALILIMLPFATFAFGSYRIKTASVDYGSNASLDRSPSSDTIYNSFTLNSNAVSLNDAVVNAIDNAKARYSFYNKSIIITKTTVSNAGKSAAELESYLIGKGYKLLAYGGVSMQLKGFKIIKHSNCFEVIIGTI